MHSSWEDKVEENNLVKQHGLIFRGFEGLQMLKKQHLSSLMQAEWMRLEIRILLSHGGVFDFKPIF